MFGLTLTSIILYSLFGSLIFILINALFLQLASSIVVKNKPNFVNALGLSFLVYIIRSFFIAIALVALFSSMGLSFYFSDFSNIDFSPLYAHIFLIISVMLIVLLLLLAIIAWIYGAMLRDEKDNKIGFWKGLLVYLLQYVFMSIITIFYALLKILF